VDVGELYDRCIADTRDRQHQRNGCTGASSGVGATKNRGTVSINGKEADFLGTSPGLVEPLKRTVMSVVSSGYKIAD
jgi:hypothetical protein